MDPSTKHTFLTGKLVIPEDQISPAEWVGILSCTIKDCRPYLKYFLGYRDFEDLTGKINLKPLAFWAEHFVSRSELNPTTRLLDLGIKGGGGHFVHVFITKNAELHAFHMDYEPASARSKIKEVDTFVDDKALLTLLINYPRLGGIMLKMMREACENTLEDMEKRVVVMRSIASDLRASHKRIA